MSFFRKLFGGASLDELRAEGDKQFTEGDFGAAKLSYEKALGKAKDTTSDAVRHVEARITECRDELARLRIAEAERLVREGEPDLARSELESAREIAASAALRDDATRRIEKLERMDARDAADDVHEATEDELYEALAGTWLEEQAEEYDAYGAPFRDAYLALHARDAETALPLLEGLVESADDPRYVWFEVARARLLTAALRRAAEEKEKGDAGPKAENTTADTPARDAPKAESASDDTPAGDAAKAESASADTPAGDAPKVDGASADTPAGDATDPTAALVRSGEEALRTFLSKIGPDEGGLTRLNAHVELARLASGRQDDEAAEKELRAATVALPDDTRSWLALGAWMRLRNRLTDARSALRSGVAVMSETVPDVALLLELALVERDAGLEAEAIQLLEAVLPRPDQDYLPEVAVPLAQLYEKRGVLARAADVWRHLANGSDVQNHYRYHREAARLLALLGDEAEARRMLLRASALAKDEAARADTASKLAELAKVSPQP